MIYYKPEIKMLVVLLFLITVNLHHRVWGLAGIILSFYLFLALLLMRPPLLKIIKWFCRLLPFLILIFLLFPRHTVSYQKLLEMISKMVLSGTAMVIFSASVSFYEAFEGLRRLKFPKILLTIVLMMYLFFDILFFEAKRMETSRNLRFFKRNYREQFKILGNMIGSLFLRAYERGERVFAAISCRGWTGGSFTGATIKINAKDIVVVILISVALLYILIGVK